MYFLFGSDEKQKLLVVSKNRNVVIYFCRDHLVGLEKGAYASIFVFLKNKKKWKTENPLFSKYLKI